MDLYINKDYRIRGYHKVMTQNSLGDAHIIEYYKDYNNNNPKGLKVRETRTYVRNEVTGIVERIDILIEFFGSDGASVKHSKNISKNLDLDRGMAKNEKSRKRLLNKAKGVAINLIGLESGKIFMRDFSVEMNLYIEGDRNPLIDGINSSSQNQDFKDALTDILDIVY